MWKWYRVTYRTELDDTLWFIQSGRTSFDRSPKYNKKNDTRFIEDDVVKYSDMDQELGWTWRIPLDSLPEEWFLLRRVKKGHDSRCVRIYELAISFFLKRGCQDTGCIPSRLKPHTGFSFSLEFKVLFFMIIVCVEHHDQIVNIMLLIQTLSFRWPHTCILLHKSLPSWQQWNNGALFTSSSCTSATTLLYSFCLSDIEWSISLLRIPSDSQNILYQSLEIQETQNWDHCHGSIQYPIETRLLNNCTWIKWSTHTTHKVMPKSFLFMLWYTDQHDAKKGTRQALLPFPKHSSPSIRSLHFFPLPLRYKHGLDDPIYIHQAKKPIGESKNVATMRHLSKGWEHVRKTIVSPLAWGHQGWGSWSCPGDQVPNREWGPKLSCRLECRWGRRGWRMYLVPRRTRWQAYHRILNILLGMRGYVVSRACRRWVLGQHILLLLSGLGSWGCDRGLVVTDKCLRRAVSTLSYLHPDRGPHRRHMGW